MPVPRVVVKPPLGLVAGPLPVLEWQGTFLPGTRTGVPVGALRFAGIALRFGGIRNGECYPTLAES